MKKKRTSSESRLSNDITTITVSKNVSNILNLITNYLDVKHQSLTSNRLGLTINDTIKYIINNSLECFDLTIDKFDLDFGDYENINKN